MCLFLSSLLKANSYDVKILSIFGQNNTGRPFFDNGSNIEINHAYKNFKKNYLNFSCKQRIKDYFNTEKFDYVIVVDTIHAVLCAKAVKNSGSKLIVWDHFNYFFNTKNSKRKKAINIVKKFADAFVVLTETDKKLYNFYYPNLNVIQCYDPLENMSNEYVDRSENKAVVAVGRYAKQKGFDLLLQAWKQIENKCNFDLKIYGYEEGQQYKLQKIIDKKKIKRVQLFPATKDISKAYETASIYVLSSRWEGQSLTLLEASDASLALVSFDCKYGPNEIIKHGYNGLLVEPENVNSLANSILKLCKDKALRKQMGKNAFYNLDNFKVETFVKTWLNILNTI